MAKQGETKPRYKIGDWVSFRYVAYDALAQVIEDRGPIGVNGRRLYRLRMDREGCEPDSFELPESSLTPASAPMVNKS